MTEQKFILSFYCYYPNCETPCKKVQTLKLSEIPRWIDAYKFTHPNYQAISVKVWCDEGEE